MDAETKATIRKLQATLTLIHTKQPVSFDIISFTNKGLIKSRDHYKNNAYGQRVRVKTTYSLTDKARQFLNVVI